MSVQLLKSKAVRRKTATDVTVTRIHNAEIADLLNRYALLLEIKGDNPFRVRAYRNAARTIEGLPRDINEMLREGNDLAELPGVGEDLAAKITKIAATGTFAPLEALGKRMPGDLADLANVPGLGAKRIKTLYRKLKIKSVAELASAARAGRLHTLPGFGVKLEQNVLSAVGHEETETRRYPLYRAEQIARPLVRCLEAVAGVDRVAIAGSFRRRKETVGDIDVLVTCGQSGPVIDALIAYPEVTEVLSKGSTRATVRLASGLQVDLRVVAKECYGAALVYFTGSKAHNIALRAIARKKHLKFNEYGVFRGGRRIGGETEEDVYAKADLPFIEPELRENTGEIEAARNRALPKLVTLKDIKGDLHAHTKASDGNASLEEMAAAAEARGYEYLAISDHTKHMGIVHGQDRRTLARQMATIDRFNANHRGVRLLKSAEVDILGDGSLALDTGLLAELDFVIAAIHGKFDLDARAQTDRLIRAMDHPAVNIIAHPTARLIGEREAIALDMKRLMNAAVERSCYLEINAQPNRLDLPDVHCRMAKGLGVKFAISTDAHSVETLDYMRFGVGQARRGWIEAGDVINTRPLALLRKLFKR